MCTAVSLLSGDFYFGRNLDYEFSYGDEVTVTPRGYTFPMRGHAPLRTRYAIIGMAYVQGDCPLYYAAINEIYAEFLPGDKPARFCIQCGLVKPDALVEIATIAHIAK